jgi:hypothetical protein
MSNITLFQNMPDSYKALLATLEPETSISGGYTSSGLRLSIRGGVFRKISAGEELGTIDSRALQTVIVKAAPISRTYYKDVYVEGSSQGPTCWSEDNKVPHPAVLASDKQSTGCNICPMNIKGSGTKDSRACRFQQRVAVILPNSDNEFVLDEAHLLSLPATSLFGDATDKMQMQTYVRKLHAHKTPLAAVVTEMRFDTDSSTPKLYFKPVRALSESELVLVAQLQKSVEVEELIRMDYKPNEKQEEVQEAAPTSLFDTDEQEQVVLPKPKKKPVPVVEEAVEPEAEDDEDEPAPTVKAKAKTQLAPQSPDLTDLMSEWDD